MALGLLAQISVGLALTAFGDPGRLALFDSLALAVFGLVLVEQLFRNLPEECTLEHQAAVSGACRRRSSSTSICLRDALLFNRIDADAWSVRGLVHALVFPLLAVSTMRNRDGRSAIALSRRVVFHSTALMASGVYLLFMAAAGYYVRYFGGSWGAGAAGRADVRRRCWRLARWHSRVRFARNCG